MILITGGTGFLGGRIASFLKDQGYKVRIGTRKYNKIFHKYLKDFEIVEMNFFDENSLLNACDAISAIFHLADVNAQEATKNPQIAIKTNGIGTLNLLNSANKKGIKKIIYFSTIHVYGESLLGDVLETTLPFPRHPYGITSRLAEDIVLENNMKEMVSVVLRLSNVVGAPISYENKCWHLIANDLCRQVMETKTLKVNSNPNIERDFISLKSLLKVCLKLIETEITDNKIWGNIFNISSGDSISLKNLTNLIAKQSRYLFNGFNPEIKFLSHNNSKTIKKYIINSNKAKKFGLLKDETLNSDIDELLLKCNKWFKG